VDLLVIRHAEAAPPEAGQDDEARPLTPKGKRATKRVTQGLVTLVPEIDVLATSPLRRAVQTAKIVRSAFGNPAREELEALAPAGSREEVLTWLQDRSDPETVAIVGHEPHLGLLTSWLLASPLNHFMEFKKGGACLITWPDHPTAGTAWLKWALTPGQLEKLGEVS
jgi:phosphohistidine phosphatase